MSEENRKEILTPIGKGTVVGISSEGDAILVMHSRPKDQQDKTHGPTFIRWWGWNGQEITGEFSK